MLSFDEIAWLRDNSPAWRLLRADNGPLVLSVLHQVFVEDNVTDPRRPQSVPRRRSCSAEYAAYAQYLLAGVTTALSQPVAVARERKVRSRA